MQGIYLCFTSMFYIFYVCFTFSLDADFYVGGNKTNVLLPGVHVKFQVTCFVSFQFFKSSMHFTYKCVLWADAWLIHSYFFSDLKHSIYPSTTHPSVFVPSFSKHLTDHRLYVAAIMIGTLCNFIWSSQQSSKTNPSILILQLRRLMPQN